MFTEEALERYNSIRLFDRFKRLSEKYNSDHPLEHFSAEEVQSIIDKRNFGLRYDKKESFYGIKLIEANHDIRFNIGLKYGIVETIMWAKNLNSQEEYGGVFSRLMKLIQKANGVTTIEKVMYPRFESIEDLEEIISELLELFVDFKKTFTGTTSIKKDEDC